MEDNKLSANIMMRLMHRAEGNTGALMAQIEIMKGNPIDALSINMRLDSCPSIKGTNLYVLYSDLCGKDISKCAKLCTSNISNELLENACSRQDYSGRTLVAPYLK